MQSVALSLWAIVTAIAAALDGPAYGRGSLGAQ
jgi:hypothetical protein